MKYILLRGNQIFEEINEEDYKSYIKQDQVSARKCIYTIGDTKMIAIAEVQAQNIVSNIISRTGFGVMTTFEKYRLIFTLFMTALMFFFSYLGYVFYNEMGLLNVDEISKKNNELIIKKIDKVEKYLDLIGDKAKIDKTLINQETEEQIKKQQNLSNILNGNN